MHLSCLPCVLRVLPISSSLITLIIFYKGYQLWSSLLCNCLHPPVIATLVKSKFSPQHPILEQLQPMFFP
jgi:hypothetical protein